MRQEELEDQNISKGPPRPGALLLDDVDTLQRQQWFEDLSLDKLYSTEIKAYLCISDPP